MVPARCQGKYLGCTVAASYSEPIAVDALLGPPKGPIGGGLLLVGALTDELYACPCGASPGPLTGRQYDLKPYPFYNC